MKPPKKIGGNNLFVQSYNELVDWVLAHSAVSTPTVKVSPSPHGMKLTAAAGGGGGSTAPAAGPVEVYFKKSFGDYLLCTENANGTGTVYRVAKTPALRCSRLSATIYGVLFNYTYPVRADNPNTTFLYRSALNTVTNISENQGVTPSYFGVPEIIAKPMDKTNVVTVAADNTIAVGTPVSYIEDSSRAWCTFQNQAF